MGERLENHKGRTVTGLGDIFESVTSWIQVIFVTSKTFFTMSKSAQMAAAEQLVALEPMAVVKPVVH